MPDRIPLVIANDKFQEMTASDTLRLTSVRVTNDPDNQLIIYDSDGTSLRVIQGVKTIP
jgi:hypothetical protein